MVLQITPKRDVELFNDRAACIQNFIDTPPVQKTKDFVQSFFNLLTYKTASLRAFPDAEIESLTQLSKEDLSKKRLIVCIHGLCGAPHEFKVALDALKSKDLPDTAIYIPYVPNKGKDRLDEMADEIFKSIGAWASAEGDRKELVLIGVSNGARISRAIETKLTEENRGKIEALRVVSVVGARRGSSLVNLACRFGFAWAVSWVIYKPIVEEMPMDSERNRQLDENWNRWIKTGAKDLKCDFTFLASAFDAHVPDHASSLPLMPENIKARYGIISDHGHFTAIDGAASTIADLLAPPLGQDEPKEE